MNAKEEDGDDHPEIKDSDDDALPHSHQHSVLPSSSEPLHAPLFRSTSCTAPPPPPDLRLQLQKRTLTSHHLQSIAALAGQGNAREAMHLFIDHAMDLGRFAHAYPSFAPRTIRRVMHRVASRVPIVFKVSDVLTHDQMGLPMLRWTESSGIKYFLSDSEYNFLFDSERSKMLGQMSSSQVAKLRQAAGQVSRQVDLRHLDLVDGSIISEQQELVPFNKTMLECEVDCSCTSDPVEAQATGSISQAHILISETSLVLEDIRQRNKQWIETSEELLDAHQTLEFALAVQGSTEGATRLAKRDKERAEFLARARLQPPAALRVIDIKSTCQAKKVVLMDYRAHEVQQVGFSAISHTYGMEVYDVFDCQCTTEFSSAYVNPRCLVGPCPHDATVSLEGSRTRNRVVNDVLGMCENLWKAGAEYAWHDGVCIAQHDTAEVRATIECMGWVYASAKETIIFLNYIGKPMAPIRPTDIADNDLDKLTCRWHTRVWTLQEAALSNCRRYCVRVGTATAPLRHCQSLEEFEKEIGDWYKDESSKVEVIQEDRFVKLLWEVYTVLSLLLASYAKTHSFMDVDIMDGFEMWQKGSKWGKCLYALISELLVTCFNFPGAKDAICLGSIRQSKHVGDHINSILALTGVRNFVAEKDKDIEVSTIEFFKRQEQPAGLARALFSANVCVLDADVEKHMREVRRHTWPPLLWELVSLPHKYVWDFASAPPIQFEVLKNGKLELRAKLLCMAVRFRAERGRLVIDRGKEIERFLDTNSAPKESFLDASRSYLSMCVAPLPDLSRFRATAPENAACNLGIANVLMYYDYDQASSRSGDLSSSDLKGINQMRDGESFHAHLVLPMNHYRLAVEEHKRARVTPVRRDGEQCGVLPVLVVQGSTLHAPVSKIGSFVPTFTFVEAFEDILDNDEDDAIRFPGFTFVDQIVII